jgi:hypothetical protein
MPLYDHRSSLSLYSEVVTVLHFLKLVFRYIGFLLQVELFDNIGDN